MSLIGSVVFILGVVAVPVLFLLAIILGTLLLVSALSVQRTGHHRGIVVARWVGLFGAAITGLVLIFLSAGGTWPTGRLGLGAMALVAPVAGSGVLIGSILLAERSLGASGPQRMGSLAPRGHLASMPVVPAVAAALTVLATASLEMLTTRLAAPDDRGRAGRSYVWGDAVVSHSAGPFPGQWYTLPGLVALGVLVLGAGAVLLAINRRRSSDDEADVLLRRRSAVSVLGAVTMAAALTGLVVSVMAGAILLRATGAEAAHGAATVCLVLGLLSLVGAALGLVMVVLPGVFARGSLPVAARSGAAVRSAS